MKRKPLILGTAHPSGKQQTVTVQSSLSTEDKRALYQKVFERDNHTCGCCGFHSEKYQDILHLDGHEGHFAMDNLMTICTFCYQIFHLEKVSAMRSGVLIWLPEIGQATFHHIMRAIFVGRITQGPIAEASEVAFDFFMKRREQAKERIGTDDPTILARLFNEFLEEKEYKQRKEKFDGLRLMPLDRRMINEAGLEFNQFPQMMAYWRSEKGPFGETMPSTWTETFDEVREKLGISIPEITSPENNENNTENGDQPPLEEKA